MLPGMPLPQIYPEPTAQLDLDFLGLAPASSTSLPCLGVSLALSIISLTMTSLYVFLQSAAFMKALGAHLGAALLAAVPS